MSSVPLRSAPNWLNVLTSEPFGYTSILSWPLVRFSTSAANFFARRSRKSPSSPVDAGNWWEILMTLGACAKAPPAIASEQAATSAPRVMRRVLDCIAFLLQRRAWYSSRSCESRRLSANYASPHPKSTIVHIAPAGSADDRAARCVGNGQRRNFAERYRFQRETRVQRAHAGRMP